MPITGTSTLLQAHPPLCPASVLWLSWVFHLSSSLNIEATGSQVPCSSQDRARATLMPDATLAVSGSPPALIPGQRLLPGSDVVHMLSTLRRWFTCVRLSDPHLTRSRRAFSLTLTTGALYPSRSRWFGACLRRPAPRDLPSSRTHIAWRTVVRIADHKRFSLQAGANFLLKPLVQHVVQEDIGQERANYAALGRAVVGDC